MTDTDLTFETLGVKVQDDRAVFTLGPAGTDSEHEARKHFSKVLLFDSFGESVKQARDAGGFVLVPAGYVEYRRGELTDTWVDLHFRNLDHLRLTLVWASPTKQMCLAINRDRVADRRSIRSVALHPATAALADRSCGGARRTFVNAKPLAVQAAARGTVDACIGSVDVVAQTSLEPIDFFRPTMVWCLYEPLQPGESSA